MYSFKMGDLIKLPSEPNRVYLVTSTMPHSVVLYHDGEWSVIENPQIFNELHIKLYTFENNPWYHVVYRIGNIVREQVAQAVYYGQYPIGISNKFEEPHRQMLYLNNDVFSNVKLNIAIPASSIINITRLKRKPDFVPFHPIGISIGKTYMIGSEHELRGSVESGKTYMRWYGIFKCKDITPDVLIYFKHTDRYHLHDNRTIFQYDYLKRHNDKHPFQFYEVKEELMKW